MNFSKWDNHKIACVIALLTTALSYGLFLTTLSPSEDRAWEIATDNLSDKEIEAIIRWYELYEKHLPTSYEDVDGLYNLINWISLGATVTAGLTAFTIPERYRKKQETVEEEQPQEPQSQEPMWIE